MISKEKQMKICKVIYRILGAIVIIFLFIIIFVPKPQKEVKQAETKQVAQQPKQEVKEELPLIQFSGKINPETPQTGEKVVIAINVKNMSNKDIKGIRLLFSNKQSITDGLIIVNIMNGGVQDNRSFIWKDLIVKPSEEVNLNIVCQANKPGNYENIIQIQTPNSMENLKDDTGNEELHYKFTILN